MLMNGLATLSVCCVSDCVPKGSDCCGIQAGTPHYCLPGVGFCTPCPSGSVCRDTNGNIVDVTCCPNHICNSITTTSSTTSTQSTTSTTSSPPQTSNTPSISYTALPPVTVTTQIIETNTVSIKGTQPPATATDTPTPITSEVYVPFTISYTTVYLADGSTYSIAPVVSSSRSVVVIQVPPTTANPTASSTANQNVSTGTGGKVMALGTKIGIGVGVSLGAIILAILICLLIPRRKRPTWLGGDPPAPNPTPTLAPGSGARSPEMGYFGYSSEPIPTGPPPNAGAYGYNQGRQPSLPNVGGYTYNQDPILVGGPIDTGSYRYRRDPILPAGRGQGSRRVPELD
jgi:hypothetical protein